MNNCLGNNFTLFMIVNDANDVNDVIDVICY